MTSIALIKLIKKFGLSEEEINQFGENFLIKYIKFHHINHFGTSTILFIGFDEEEIEKLKKNALKYNIKVYTKISLNLNFICIEYNLKYEKRIVKARETGAILLNKSEFLEVFNESEYKINENELICPSSVNEDFRIVKPLSNFDKNIVYESFSYSNENQYLLNLFSQTCNCSEFSKGNKSSYEKGDLRRFCKHLVSEYRDSFKPQNLNGLKGFLVENRYSLKMNLKRIFIEKVSLPIHLSYENNNEWCDIYFPVKNSFVKYSYNYKEERFSYDEKPHGHVITLRAELTKIFGSKKEVKKINKKVIHNQNEGCATVLIIGLIMFFIFIFLINQTLHLKWSNFKQLH